MPEPRDPSAERPLVGHVVEEFLNLSETFIFGYLSNLAETRAFFVHLVEQRRCEYAPLPFDEPAAR